MQVMPKNWAAPANTLKRDATSKELEALALDALAHN